MSIYLCRKNFAPEIRHLRLEQYDDIILKIHFGNYQMILPCRMVAWYHCFVSKKRVADRQLCGFDNATTTLLQFKSIRNICKLVPGQSSIFYLLFDWIGLLWRVLSPSIILFETFQLSISFHKTQKKKKTRCLQINLTSQRANPVSFVLWWMSSICLMNKQDGLEQFLMLLLYILQKGVGLQKRWRLETWLTRIA